MLAGRNNRLPVLPIACNHACIVAKGRRLNPLVDSIAEIKRRDARGEPERLALKYAMMRADPRAFLRATSHLFYLRLAGHAALPDAPPVWACGDLHLENFGTRTTGGAAAAFGVNDYDECLLAPAYWDVLRCASSIYVARKKLGLDKIQAKTIVAEFVLAFARQLQAGLPDEQLMDAAIPASSAPGKDDGTRALAARTVVVAGVRSLRVDGTYALPATAQQKRSVRATLARAGAQAGNFKGLTVLDVARRVAGLASLGTRRYSVLAARGKRKTAPVLLDLKQARAPASAALVGIAQPRWPSPATRVVTIETLAEQGLTGILAAVGTQRSSMVLRELRPREARLRLADMGTGTAVRPVLTELARAAAGVHLRTAGHAGAADLAALAAFGSASNWRVEVTLLAIGLARQNKLDWRSFCTAYDGGQFG